VVFPCKRYFITREAYFTTMILAMAVTMAALFVYVRWIAASRAMAILGLLVFTFSRAFVDYSSSGLENPLSHLLLFMFLAVYLRHEGRWGQREVFMLSLVASLGVLNRMDTALVYAPPMLYVLVMQKRPRLCLAAVLGTLPFLAWEAFSLFYYGFPFPNTAYAKLSHGIEPMALLKLGGYYLTESLRVDPLTLVAVAVGVGAAVLGRRRAQLPVAAGILLYLIYVARIGGDFMSGRFFTVPLVAGVVLLTAQVFAPRFDLRRSLAGYPTVLSGPRYGLDRGRLVPQQDFEEGMLYWEDINVFFDSRDVADERAYYYQFTGLLRDPEVNGSRELRHVWSRSGYIYANLGVKAAIVGCAGFLGYHTGPQVYLIDIMALNDPLLARQPTINHRTFRIGHHKRAIPLGYPESVRHDRNLIKDPVLARYYDDLRLATRGPLVSRERFRAIWRLNTRDYGLPTGPGQYEADLREPEEILIF
jgi:arabinofuranosyltransferase